MPDKQEKRDSSEGRAEASSEETHASPDESGLVPTAPPTTPSAEGRDAEGRDAGIAGGESSEAVDNEVNERPTASPPFDPIAFARDMLRPSPPKPIPAARLPRTDPSTIITPPLGVSAQHVAESRRPAGQTTGWGAPAGRAAFAVPPPPQRRTPPGLGVPTPSGGIRRKTPTSTISLANMIIPSILPPRDASTVVSKPATAEPRKESITSLNALDSEWADLEMVTRPPPPGDGPNEDPVLEIVKTPPVLDDGDEEEDADGVHEPSVETVRRAVPEEVLANVRAASASRPPVSEREMNDRVSLGDYSGALAIAEEILGTDPNHAVAKACAERCRGVLKQMYATRIGPLDRVPLVMVPRDQLRWLSIDHRAGFVLSLVDGVSSLEMIIDVSGMPEIDTLRILSELAQQRIISLR